MGFELIGKIAAQFAGFPVAIGDDCFSFHLTLQRIKILREGEERQRQGAVDMPLGKVFSSPRVKKDSLSGREKPGGVLQ